MKTKAKICIDCKAAGTIERRRCGDCLKIYNKNRAKNYYRKLNILGIERTRYGKIICCICKEEMTKNHPNQVAHGKCKKQTVVSYNGHPRDKRGMMVGRGVVLNLKILIPEKMVVHHIDENPINNSFKNLMMISLSTHSKLHAFLREQWVINKGIYGENIDLYWKKILVKLNFVWIEKIGIELIYLDYSADLSIVVIDEKKIYIFKRVKKDKCDICKTTELMDESLLFKPDQKDSDHIQILCPDCHASETRKSVAVRMANKLLKNLVVVKVKRAKKIKIKKGRIGTRKVVRPNIEDLILEVKDNSYCWAGRKYGVSDNAIRKWIKLYKRDLAINENLKS